MEYRQLGRTNLKVSAICLGTMTWGEQNTQEQAFEQLDAAIGAGINFIDTAEIYPVPPKAETYGQTETILGNWLAARKNRNKVVIATKVAGPSESFSYIRDGKPRFDRKNVEAAVDDSLKRLQTDFIDLYQLHWPDRNANNFGKLGFVYDPNETMTPLQETLEILGGQIRAGKIRHIGLSNETPWGAMKSISYSQTPGIPRPVSIQNPYNLLNRSFEIGLAEIAHREQMGLLAYSPLGFGILSGKYCNGARPAGARLSIYSRFQRYFTPEGVKAMERYVQLARDHGLNPAQMALSYVTSRSFTTSTIIGATNIDQLNSNIASVSLNLSPAVLKEIDAIHQQQPNPCP